MLVTADLKNVSMQNVYDFSLSLSLYEFKMRASSDPLAITKKPEAKLHILMAAMLSLQRLQKYHCDRSYIFFQELVLCVTSEYQRSCGFYLTNSNIRHVT